MVLGQIIRSKSHLILPKLLNFNAITPIVFNKIQIVNSSNKPSVNINCKPNLEDTGSGDNGETNTLAGIIRPKDHQLFHAIGVTEELTSYLGLAKEFANESNHEYVDKLKRIQTTLIDVCSCISKYSEESIKQQTLSDVYTKELEEWIQEYSTQLPPVDQFIIPGGGKASASLHIARSICRKAERQIVTLVRNGHLGHETQIYLNRLGDFLFTCARMAAKYDKRTELVYIPPPSSNSSNSDQKDKNKT